MAKKQKMKKETRGRKPIPDKKAMLRIYIEQSIIDANGGKLQCEADWILHLKSVGKKVLRKKDG